jgi:hypothetical protein
MRPIPHHQKEQMKEPDEKIGMHLQMAKRILE